MVTVGEGEDVTETAKCTTANRNVVVCRNGHASDFACMLDDRSDLLVCRSIPE